jgi:ureidoglycolate lyase
LEAAAKMTLKIKLQTLTKNNFAPFGDVIETAGAERILINEGTTERFHDLTNIDVGSEGGHTLINIFRGQPRPQPIQIKMMERHPLSSQAFIPLKKNPYIIVVATISKNVGPKDLHAFRAEGDQGVNYKRNLWHHPLLTLENNHEFLVVDRGGPGENCEEMWFTEEQGTAQLVL